MLTLSGVLLFIWAFGLLLTCWGTWLSVKRFRPERGFKKSDEPISILKPIKGIDSDLAINLESFFNLEYSRFELVFCIAEENDPAKSIIEKLINAYPQIDARLMIGRKELGINPKVNTIAEAYETAKYDQILISDSNVRVFPNYLQDINQGLDKDTGIATAIVAGTGHEDIGGRLEANYLNTFYARWMNLAAWFGFPAVVGKCMFFRRSVLNRVGGIKSFACYIAEDYMAGQAIEKLGLKVKVLHIPVRQHIGEYTIKSYWQRHVRWGRIRKSQAPVAFTAEPLFFAVTTGVFGAYSLNYLFHFSTFSVFTSHMIVWGLLDLVIIQKLDSIRFKILICWLLREFLALPLWFHAILGTTVSWRGKIFRLQFGGLVEEA